VIPEIEKADQRSPEDLGLLYLRSPITGALVPLKSLVTWKEEASPQNIPHAQHQEAATISFNIFPGVPLGIVTKAIEKRPPRSCLRVSPVNSREMLLNSRNPSQAWAFFC